MTNAEELFHKIATELPDTKEGKMFGALCIKAPNGKAGVMFWYNDIIFKLQDANGGLGTAFFGAFKKMERACEEVDGLCKGFEKIII